MSDFFTRAIKTAAHHAAPVLVFRNHQGELQCCLTSSPRAAPILGGQATCCRVVVVFDQNATPALIAAAARAH